MSELVGIQESKELTVFLAQLVNLIDSQRKGIDPTQIIQEAVPVLMSGPSALKGAKSVPAELKDLDAGERSELSTSFQTTLKLKVSGPVRERSLEQAYSALINLGDAIEDLITNQDDEGVPA